MLFDQADVDGKPQALIDPNTLFPDGSVDLASYAPSPDGKYLAYGLSAGGSDWQEIHVRDLGAATILGGGVGPGKARRRS